LYLMADDDFDRTLQDAPRPRLSPPAKSATAAPARVQPKAALPVTPTAAPAPEALSVVQPTKVSPQHDVYEEEATAVGYRDKLPDPYAFTDQITERRTPSGLSNAGLSQSGVSQATKRSGSLEGPTGPDEDVITMQEPARVFAERADRDAAPSAETRDSDAYEIDDSITSQAPRIENLAALSGAMREQRVTITEVGDDGPTARMAPVKLDAVRAAPSDALQAERAAMPIEKTTRSAGPHPSAAHPSAAQPVPTLATGQQPPGPAVSAPNENSRAALGRTAPLAGAGGPPPPAPMGSGPPPLAQTGSGAYAASGPASPQGMMTPLGPGSPQPMQGGQPAFPPQGMMTPPQGTHPSQGGHSSQGGYVAQASMPAQGNVMTPPQASYTPQGVVPPGYQSGAHRAMALMATEHALPRLEFPSSPAVMQEPEPKPRRWVLGLSIVMVLMAAACLGAAIWLRTHGLRLPF